MKPTDFQQKAITAITGKAPSKTAVARFGVGLPTGPHSLMPTPLASLAEQLPDDILKMDEEELEAKTSISRQDRRVRISYWLEYEKAASRQRPVDLAKVLQHTGVPSWAMYQMKLEDNPHLLAWMLTPPASYKLQITEAVEVGLKRVMDIIQLPFTQNGKFSPGTAKLVLEAYKAVEQRQYGMYTQKSLNLNVEAKTGAPGLGDEMPEDIDRKIKELEAEFGPIPETDTDKATPPGSDVIATTSGQGDVEDAELVDGTDS